MVVPIRRPRRESSRGENGAESKTPLGRPFEIDLAEEMGGADLGDVRLSRRLARVVTALSQDPEASFPRLAATDAELTATYRFLGNGDVTCQSILSPHIEATVERAARARIVLALHDTSEFNFGPGAREKLGRVGGGGGKSQGFYGHFALAVAADESRTPLGVLGMEPLFRGEKRKGRRGHRKLQSDPTNESLRWNRMQKSTSDLLAGRAEVVHVMDREADNYHLLAQMVRRGDRFVVRMSQDRVLQQPSEWRTVREMLDGATVLAERQVPLSIRGRSPLPSNRRHHPERGQRVARLQFSAATVTLPRPVSSSRCPEQTLTLNLVRVHEVNTPDREEPVEWRLWTTEPVETAEQILAVVDIYRTRWVIEEYFKALKTGCAYESRQLESQRSLLNALAIFAPIAWQLLLLRSAARTTPLAPVLALTVLQLVCLRAICKERHKIDLPKRPSCREAMLAVARIGGHIKNNGDPGWLVLARGFSDLRAAVMGYQLALSAPRCDQS